MLSALTTTDATLFYITTVTCIGIGLIALNIWAGLRLMRHIAQGRTSLVHAMKRRGWADHAGAVPKEY